MPGKVFRHDQFLGRYESRWEADGFPITRLTPTVPEDQVHEHTHSEAHYVLVLEGHMFRPRQARRQSPFARSWSTTRRVLVIAIGFVVMEGVFLTIVVPATN